LYQILNAGGQTRLIPSDKAANKNALKFFDNGAVKNFEVSKDIKEVAQRISPFQLDVVGKIISAPGRVFKAGTTGLNPVFTASNLAKDQATSAILSKDAPATSKHFLNGLWESMKDFGVENNDPVWQKFLSVSGDTTSYDLTRNIKKTSEVVKEVANGPTRYKNALLHPVRTLEDFNSITEKATRFQNFKGIYEKTLKETGDEAQALQEATLAAWHTTIDFNSAGDWGRVANLIFPYFNPAIQGSRQLGRNLAERPIATLVKGTAIVGVPLLGATLWNLGDPQRKAVYDNIPDYEKENNLVIVMPGTKQNKDGTYNVIKLPFPPGVSNLYQPVRRGAEAAVGDKPLEAMKMLTDITQAFTGPVNASNPKQNVSTLVPQFARPLVQSATNTDLYTGKKIVPDYIDQSGADNKDKAYKYTSGTARFLGKALGQSPIKVEKFVKDTFGTVGANALNASDNVLSKFGVIPKEQIGGQSVGEGFQRRFAKVQGTENTNKSDGAKFFDQVAQVTKGLNRAELDAFNGTIIPSKKDFQGNVVNDKTYYDSASKATTWLRYPKTFEASKAIDAAQRADGKPGDPLYDLPPDQQKIVLNMMANYSPGNKEEKAMRELNPWLTDFNQKRSAYFEQLSTNGSPVDPKGITVPKADKNLQAKLDQIKGITDKAQRAQFYADNPDVNDFYGKVENYQRVKRDFLGLPQFDRYPTASPEVQKVMDTYNSLPKADGPAKKDGTPSSPARSAWIKSHPKEWAALTDQWTKQDFYKLQEEGSLAVYEGLDFTPEGIKSIQDIAKALGVNGGGGYSNPYADYLGIAKLLGGIKTDFPNAPKITPASGKPLYKFRQPYSGKKSKLRVKLN
jgi:hypothetical protein